ncbi:MAG: carbohydrate kinase family protein [Patescibacteria group bacterium]|nr:carbohydrate kinase family protein [Patescibacteria group bacterium]
MKKIICIGSATKDIFLEIREGKVVENSEDLTAQKLISFEFGAKIYAQGFREELGGSAVNVASGLHKCGFRTFVFSRSSKSQTGKWIIKEIGKRKLKKNYFQQTGGGESEIAVVISERKHKDHVIFRTGDSVQQFDVRKALNKFREKVDWIYIGSQKKGWSKKVDEIVKFSKERKAKIAINPSSYQVEKGSKKFLEMLSEFQVVFMNKDEAIELLQKAEGKVEDNIKYLFSKIKKYSPNVVVITDGVNGAYVLDNDEIISVSTQVKDVVDTVGAGDAFSSAFIAAYVNDQDSRRALTWGIANSGAVISKEGATNGLLKVSEMRRLQQSLFKKIKVVE